MKLGFALSFDEAVQKHKEMWESMQNILGNRPSLEERAAFKAGWVAARKEKLLIGNCYLCQYDLQITGNCENCPVNWGPHRCYGCEYGEINWRTSKISDILGLPLRKKYVEEEE